MAFDQASPVGYAYLVVEEPIRRGVLMLESVADKREPIERALFGAASEHARSLGLTVLHVDVAEDDNERSAMLTSAGMAQVRTHRHLRREGTRKEGSAPPEGMTLRLATPDDVPALTDLQNASFTGSWGYCPNTAEEIGYRVFELEEPPDPVLLLHVDGELAGYCWTHHDGPGRPGVIGMVGVYPERQGQGLGRIVTTAGLDYLIETDAVPVDITVDAENTPAVRLYEGIGFETRWRSNWYELKLD